MKKVHIIGIGMGNPQSITLEGKLKIEESNMLIGAERMVNALASDFHEKSYAITADDIFTRIQNATDGVSISVLMSGDIGFYSGATKLRELFTKNYGNFLGNDKVWVSYVPGISSFVYFLSKLGKPWEDVTPISLHGRDENPVIAIKKNKKTFFLTDSKDNTVRNICKKLTENCFGELDVFIGEKLSYSDEKITVGKAKDFVDMDFETLSVVYIENIQTDSFLDFKSTLGISDDFFVRAKVPMTKEEIRTVSVSKMNLTDTDCIYDIGAGTGSVSIELARACKYGTVYAVEQEEDAVELIKQNKEKFNASNLHIVKGKAPDVLDDLPKPDKAFIGGSKGNLKDIISTLLKKNPDIRIVATAVSLEAICELTTCIKDFGFEDASVVQMSVAHSKKLGNYNLMMGQNPVFIVSMKHITNHEE